MQWIADTIYSVLTLRAFTPRHVFRSALGMMRQSAAILQCFSPTLDGRIVWTEFQNKIEAFSLFEYVDFETGGESPYSLQKLVHRAFHLGPYRSVWAVEGVGHCHANVQRFASQFPDHLLCKKKTEGLPAASLIPLHTGMGLALAQSVLDSISKQPARSIRPIDSFAQLCRDNSREGYAGAVFEALGFVVSSLYPHLSPVIHGHLAQDKALLAYFWHGVGRGIYFNPWNFPPFCSAPWKALEMCRSEPPDELGRRNAVAGLAWALTLVNIRHPEIIATFLKYHAKEVAKDDAFASGVCSSLIIWREVSPTDSYIDALRRYVPQDASSIVLELWDQCITQSCLKALSYMGMSLTTRVSEVFHYQQFQILAQPERLIGAD